jgi:Holliday junction resolvasome RuvABC endonuclease subunit
MKTVLGFDISSTTIGWCALNLDDDKISIIKYDYIKPLKNGTIIERIVDTRNKIKKIIESIKPDHIGIEDIIQFMQGKSTAKTIITLTTFNRMIGLLAYDYLNKSPELFSVMTIRHGLKINNTLPKKEEIPELVAKHLGITFPYQLNKKGKIKVENYDMADGIAVALYYSLKLSGKLKPKKQKKTKLKKVKKK